VDAYVRAREIDPTLPGIDMAIGNLYLKLGEVTKGRRYLGNAVSQRDTPPEMVYNYAVSLMKDKKYTAAIDPLRRVTRERPDWPQAWAALASSLRLAGQYAAAIEPYQRALELTPDPKLAFAMGVSANKAGDSNKAVMAYQQALALDPEYVEARYNLSLVFMDVGRYEEALTSFDKLMELEPDSYRALFSQGRALFHLGRYHDALDKYEMALEQKETANVFNAMGIVYDKLGDKKAAKEYYDEAKRLQ
jgi:superkiller protein 3